MKKRTVLVLGFSLLFCACTMAPKTPNRFGVVKTVKVEQQVNNETGQIQLVRKIVNEKAERSVVDKDSDALMTPQKVVSFKQFFSNYAIGPNGEILASVYNQNGSNGSDLWIYKNSKMRLTNTTYDHSDPSFSADGRYVYFVSYKGKRKFSQFSQDSYIWKTSATGNGGITRIGSPAFVYGSPLESPDGKKILFASIELFGNPPYIWYMNRNGSLPTQLKQGIEPQWINNNKILFAARDESTGMYAIWSCNTDGSMLTELISDNKYNCINPSMSKDGKYIAYVKEKASIEGLSKTDPSFKDRIKETRDIYVYRVADGLSQQVTTNQSRDDLPKWSPDGKYLYFRSTRGLGWNIWRLETSFLNQ